MQNQDIDVKDIYQNEGETIVDFLARAKRILSETNAPVRFYMRSTLQDYVDQEFLIPNFSGQKLVDAVEYIRRKRSDEKYKNPFATLLPDIPDDQKEDPYDYILKPIIPVVIEKGTTLGNLRRQIYNALELQPGITLAQIYQDDQILIAELTQHGLLPCAVNLIHTKRKEKQVLFEKPPLDISKDNAFEVYKFLRQALKVYYGYMCDFQLLLEVSGEETSSQQNLSNVTNTFLWFTCGRERVGPEYIFYPRTGEESVRFIGYDLKQTVSFDKGQLIDFVEGAFAKHPQWLLDTGEEDCEALCMRLQKVEGPISKEELHQANIAILLCLYREIIEQRLCFEDINSILSILQEKEGVSGGSNQHFALPGARP